jgi:hypothetical protein
MLPVWLNRRAMPTGIVPLSLRRAQPFDQRIGWAPYTFSAPIQDVRVDHGRSHVDVAQPLLNCPDVVAVFQEMRGKRVSRWMLARDQSRDEGDQDRRGGAIRKDQGRQQ